MQQQTPFIQRAGVVVFAVLLAAGSIVFFAFGGGFARYQKFFSYLPAHVIQLRYMVSISLRTAGIVLGLGLIWRKELFRKFTVGFCLLNILAVPFKHPWQAFVYLSAGSGSPEPALWAAYLVVLAADCVFYACGLYFFSRPGVKQLFK